MNCNWSLLILEENELKKYPLFEINKIDNYSLEYEVNHETILNYWPTKDVNYSPYVLGATYTDTIGKIFQRFEPFAGRDKLLEEMMEVNVTFATKEAYSRKRNEENFKQKDKTNGYFCNVEGISLSLQESLYWLSGTIIHEYAHFLNAKLKPELYSKATIEMREMVAILVQESFGYKRNYYKDTVHYQAKRLLDRLYNTPFKEMDFVEQWDLLTSIMNTESPFFTVIPPEETT